MTTKGLILGAILLILAITSTLTIFKLFQNKQQLGSRRAKKPIY